jgi:hypothetical protein
VFAADPPAGLQTDCKRTGLGKPDMAGNGSGRDLLHGRHDVGVAVERERYRQVAALPIQIATFEA